jgi:2-oxoglutarate dehydrogenase E2 component (dihydrolipoamide succinyltransferase)
MMRSLATSAHTLVVTEVDYHGVDPVRRAARLSFLPFVARAVIDAIGEFPHVNASVGDDQLIVHRRINLGVAVDVEFQALVVPVIKDAGGKRLEAISDAVTDLAARAKAKRLTADDLTGGTFTITNVGSYGTVVTGPIINQPQVAILSSDGVRMRPVAVRGPAGDWTVAVHPVGNLSLSFDHRAFDGAYAAAFLARVRDLLEQRDWSQEV